MYWNPALRCGGTTGTAVICGVGSTVGSSEGAAAVGRALASPDGAAVVAPGLVAPGLYVAVETMDGPQPANREAAMKRPSERCWALVPRMAVDARTSRPTIPAGLSPGAVRSA